MDNLKRRIDDLGRIVIPKPVRISIGIVEGDELEIIVNNDRSITLKPVNRRFIDYLKSGIELDCDLIIGDVDMPASFVWDEDSRITEAGYQKFKSLMDAPYDVLQNGNIEIFCDDDKLGGKFVYAAAGYVSEDNYKAWFEGEWCKC